MIPYDPEADTKFLENDYVSPEIYVKCLKSMIAIRRLCGIPDSLKGIFEVERVLAEIAAIESQMSCSSPVVTKEEAQDETTPQ